jgi:predicted 3-demethylubiquinone-9 3-methyltransferase (glyoxalase superfamily)
MKNPIYPCLWFDGNAKEAAEFYCGVFPDSEITSENPMVVTFESSGQKFMCLNGGPEFSFNPSISFFAVFETEKETERVWNSLLKGGEVLMPFDEYAWSKKYGWLQDRFGVSWQISVGKFEDVGQKFTPSFLFTGNGNGRAEEAVKFYTSVFNNSEIAGILKYEKEDNDKEGNVKHAQFRLEGQVFMAMDSSLLHKFTFNEAVSMVVECDTQKEIDYFWNKLTEGGEESQCGWLKDRFGVSWQIVPSVLEELMSDPNRSQRVVDAFLKMKKFEIEKLVTA